MFAGLRTANETFIQYDSGEGELYDQMADPHELKNVYGSMSQAHRKKLSSWLGTLRDAGGNALRAAEESPP